MKQFLLDLIIRHPLFILIAVAVITILFGLGLRHGLPLNVSPLLFVEEHSREREDYNRIRQTFGDDLFLVVAVESDDVFAPASLAKLRALHQQIEKLNGIAEIISLSNAPYARGEANSVTLEKLIPDLPGLAPARLAEARNIALSDKLFAGQIVARDGKTAALNILLKAELSTDARYAVTAQICEVAKRAGFSRVFFAGDPFSQWRGVEAIRHDLTLFLPLTLLLVAFLLWLCFRSLVAVVLPLLTVGIGLFWVFGLMGHVGSQFNILSLMLPTVLLAIGCSYVIHVFNQIGLANAERGMRNAESDRSALIAEALQFIALPVMVSALTIIAGFLSLAFTKIPGIRSTAIFAAVGAGATMLLALTFVPAALLLASKKAIQLNVGLGGQLALWLEKTGRFAVSKATVLYLVTGVMCALSVIGIFRLVIDVDYYGFFKSNSEAAIGSAEIGKRLAGAMRAWMKRN